MANTLGLDDLDDVSILRDVEAVFEITITSEQAAAMVVVGDLFDVIRRALPPDASPGKCATAMAFYRLRHALVDLRAARKLSPQDELAKSALDYRHLETESGLVLPRRTLSRIGTGGCLTALAAFVALLIVVAAPVSFVAPWVFCAVIAAGIAVVCVAPREPDGPWRTLGDLAEYASVWNYGKLIKLGARHTDGDVWNALVKIIHAHTSLPEEEITKQTFFFRSQCKRAA